MDDATKVMAKVEPYGYGQYSGYGKQIESARHMLCSTRLMAIMGIIKDCSVLIVNASHKQLCLS
jgi:hypothetical protein